VQRESDIATSTFALSRNVQDLLQVGQERGFVTSDEIMALVEEFDMAMEDTRICTLSSSTNPSKYEQSPVTQGVLEPTEPTLDLSIETVTHDPLRLSSKKPARYPTHEREEIELAKLIEARQRAKDRMIQSNLRLVISIAKTTTPKT
jgi:DNA-directed RNA polymerase sigma subunit (sigma70/sigma32)